MSYSVVGIPPFDRQLKRLLKKYPSLKVEILELSNSLIDNPLQGTSIGNSCYKIGMAIASKGKGKSGGARIITNLHITKTTVYLLSIYDKSEQPDISDNEIKVLLKFIE